VTHSDALAFKSFQTKKFRRNVSTFSYKKERKKSFLSEKLKKKLSKIAFHVILKVMDDVVVTPMHTHTQTDIIVTIEKKPIHVGLLQFKSEMSNNLTKLL
jgi:hypothetical protein